MKLNSLNTFGNTLLVFFATAGTVIANILGGWDIALKLLVAVMVVDYITGVLIALLWHKSGKTKNGAFESNQSIKGLFRKMMYLVLVYISVMLDNIAGTQANIRTAVILFFIANDGFSILENLGIMGVPFPPFMKNAFEALKSKSETSVK